MFFHKSLPFNSSPCLVSVTPSLYIPPLDFQLSFTSLRHPISFHHHFLRLHRLASFSPSLSSLHTPTVHPRDYLNTLFLTPSPPFTITPFIIVASHFTLYSLPLHRLPELHLTPSNIFFFSTYFLPFHSLSPLHPSPIISSSPPHHFNNHTLLSLHWVTSTSVCHSASCINNISCPPAIVKISRLNETFQSPLNGTSTFLTPFLLEPTFPLFSCIIKKKSGIQQTSFDSLSCSGHTVLLCNHKINKLTHISIFLSFLPRIN